jgi:hypothetical protein
MTKQKLGAGGIQPGESRVRDNLSRLERADRLGRLQEARRGSASAAGPWVPAQPRDRPPLPDGTVVDGELVAWHGGRRDVAALQPRLHNPRAARALRRVRRPRHRYEREYKAWNEKVDASPARLKVLNSDLFLEQPELVPSKRHATRTSRTTRCPYWFEYPKDLQILDACHRPPVGVAGLAAKTDWALPRLDGRRASPGCRRRLGSAPCPSPAWAG